MNLLESAFEYVVGLLFAVGAWLWAALVGRVNKLEDAHHNLEVKLNDKFVEKLDEVRKEIKADIQKIADKLDSKQDKKRS